MKVYLLDLGSLVIDRSDVLWHIDVEGMDHLPPSGPVGLFAGPVPEAPVKQDLVDGGVAERSPCGDPARDVSQTLELLHIVIRQVGGKGPPSLRPAWRPGRLVDLPERFQDPAVVRRSR